MEQITASINLPYPPTVNTYWRNFRGRTILSKRGMQFKDDAMHLMMVERFPKGLIGDVTVHIHVYPPDYRKRDIDNIIKPVLDGMQDYGVFEASDEQVSLLVVQRHLPDDKTGRAEVTITGMTRA